MGENVPTTPGPDGKPELLDCLSPGVNRKAGRSLRFVFITTFCVTGVAMLILVLLVSMLVPIRRSSGVKCSSNLRQIGQALQLYAMDYRGYPRTRYDPTKPLGNGFTGVGMADSFGGNTLAIPGPAVNDPTAALFLLVKMTGLGPEVFVCPSSAQQKDTFTVKSVTYTCKTTSNFTSADNLSYSFTNMYPRTAAVELGYKWSPNVTSDFAIAADRNDADPREFAGVDANASQSQQNPMNTRNHEQHGQSVLYNDGHVDWVTSPWAGANRDNIYTAAKVYWAGRPFNPPQSSDKWPEPQSDLDTVLVPRKANGF